MKQTGPKEIIIPEQKFLSCYGCEFHKVELVASGRNPIRADNCTHPKFPLTSNRLTGNLSRDNDDQVKTPKMCPFIPKKESSGGFYGRGTSGNFMRTQIAEHG
jgi:hypothetical protein